MAVNQCEQISLSRIVLCVCTYMFIVLKKWWCGMLGFEYQLSLLHHGFECLVLGQMVLSEDVAGASQDGA